MRGILITIVSITYIGIPSAFGQVTVEVSRIHSAVHYANIVRLAPGQTEIVELLPTPNQDQYKAIVQVPQGTLRLVAIDGRDIEADNPNPHFLIDRSVSGSERIDLPRLPSSKGVAAVLANVTNSYVDAQITVFRVGERTPQVVSNIKKWIEIPINALNLIYNLPSFKVSLRPCGFSSAYSDPNIVICTELLADLTEKNLADALMPILLHELAHSLLYLWGLPGYDNEDVADEFAAVFLASHSPELINVYIKWLERNDSITEAVVQLINGDRHTISIQRARNMKAALTKPDELLRRWEKLLSPFLRNRK